MPMSNTDLVFMLSAPGAAAGAATAGTSSTSTTEGGSLGKYVSTTALNTGTPLNNAFPDITGTQNANGLTDYQCFFVQNNNATYTAQNVAVWINNQVAGGATISIALDNAAASAKTSSTQQADVIVNATTAPTAVGAFTSAASSGSALSIGSLAPNQVRAIWVKRTISNTSAVNNDGYTLEIDFDTTA